MSPTYALSGVLAFREATHPVIMYQARQVFFNMSVTWFQATDVFIASMHRQPGMAGGCFLAGKHYSRGQGAYRLPLDHAIGVVVQQQDDDMQLLLHRCQEFLKNFPQSAQICTAILC